MHKAFEFEAEYDRHGKVLRRRWSVGPVLITSVLTVFLAITGHSAWASVIRFIQAVKWW